MKLIPLTQGKSTVVDDDDYELLSLRKWHYLKIGYAARRTEEQYIYMHREIMSAPTGMEVDHINGDGLDNRRSNLRVCTHAENMRNRKLAKDNTSGYIGVTWNKERSKWQSQIGVSGKNINIGCFPAIEDAARAYNEAAKKYFGEFARLNEL